MREKFSMRHALQLRHINPVMANSLARNSTDRIPSPTRGNLNTPVSSRLYHNTKPSRSPTRILNLSPRGERKIKRWPLCGLVRSPLAPSPPVGRTRSACQSLPWPARFVPLGLEPASSNSAARSCFCLQRGHQCPHVIDVEARRHHQTATVPNFDRSIATGRLDRTDRTA
jgi:hypothetical protein